MPTRHLYLSRERATAALIFFAVISGAAKIYLGFPYTPLALDFVLLALFVSGVGQLRVTASFTSFTVLALLIIGTVQLFNPYLHDSVFKLKGYRLAVFSMLAFFLPFMETLTPRRLERFARYLLLAGTVAALFAMKQWVAPSGMELTYAAQEGVGSKFYGDQYYRPADVFRVFGTLISSTHLAAVMLICLSIGLSQVIFDRRKRNCIRYFLALFAATLLLTFSRTAFIGGLGLLVYLAYAQAFDRQNSSLSKKLAVLALVMAILVLSALLALVVPILRARLLTLGSINEVSALLSRLDLWAARVHDIQLAPWGYGTGLAGFHETGNYYLIADNQFLKVFIEWGWLAGALFACMIIVSLIRSMPLPSASVTQKAWIVGINASVIGIFPLMATGQILEAYPVNLMFWYLLGLREALFRGVLFSFADCGERQALSAGISYGR